MAWARIPTPALAIDAAIIGAAGYGGGELLRLLTGHPAVRSVQAVSRSHNGKPWAATHPNLRGVADELFVGEIDWQVLAGSQAPVLFAAMGHLDFASQWAGLKDAMDSAAPGLSGRLVVIDLSADFRLDDRAAFTRYYGPEHPCAAEFGQWTYGLTEWNRAAVARSRRIANPGCFATALSLAIAPLAQLGAPRFIALDAKTGSTGSGATPGEGTHHPTRAQDFRAYNVLKHRHQAEVERVWREQGRGHPMPQLSFVPQSAPLTRGIFTVLHAHFDAPVDAVAASAAFRSAYASAPFVRLVEGSPRLAAVTGSNFCDLAVTVDGNVVVVIAALDNLVKGMAGQAVQNMNVALGLDERTGLWVAGRYPG